MRYGAILPHLFTMGNLFCGFLALHYVIGGNLVPAAWLIVLGAVLDKMDGKIARALGEDSRFGIELDSLVDICTFGLVPAAMVYLSMLHTPWGVVPAFAYLVCGALRLARFNVLSLDGDRGEFYLGLPIPMAAICLSQFIVFAHQAWPAPWIVPLCVTLVLLLAALMISPLEYDSMPDMRGTGLGDRLKQLYFLLGVALVIFSAESFFFLLVTGYILSGIYRWIVGHFQDEVTQHA